LFPADLNNLLQTISYCSGTGGSEPAEVAVRRQWFVHVARASHMMTSEDGNVTADARIVLGCDCIVFCECECRRAGLVADKAAAVPEVGSGGWLTELRIECGTLGRR
jgi:hypothetical protein